MSLCLHGVCCRECGEALAVHLGLCKVTGISGGIVVKLKEAEIAFDVFCIV